MSKIIITGASGLIVNAFKRMHANNQDDIYTLSRKQLADEKNFQTDYSVESLSDIFSQVKIFGGGTDITVIHAASQTPVNNEKEGFSESVRITENLYSAAIDCGISNVTLLSSMAVYPDNTINADVCYDASLPAMNTYGEMKRKVEQVAILHSQNVNTKIMRIGMVLFDNIADNKNIFGFFMSQAKSGKPITLFDKTSDFYQSFIFVDDVVDAINHVVEYKDNHIFNVCNFENLTNYELAKAIDEKFHTGIQINVAPANLKTTNVQMVPCETYNIDDATGYLKMREIINRVS